MIIYQRWFIMMVCRKFIIILFIFNFIVGQDQRQLGILLVPNFEEVLAWAAQKGLFLQEDKVRSEVDKNLMNLLKRKINELLASRKGSRAEERVVGVALVKPFTIENGLLTQTLKQRRDRIAARDTSAIASIYGFKLI